MIWSYLKIIFASIPTGREKGKKMRSYDGALSPRLMSRAGFSFSYSRITGKLFNKKELKGTSGPTQTLIKNTWSNAASLTSLLMLSFQFLYTFVIKIRIFLHHNSAFPLLPADQNFTRVT